jgi:succinate dehydrogenase / fumarate reductase cytochrome b subunit
MRPRPTAPHLTIYRPQWTSVLSILHRVAGVALMGGLFLFTWWCLAILYGPEAYGIFIDFSKSWLGRFMIGGWSWALMYHLCNGIRHLLWDLGKFCSVEEVQYTGYISLSTSFVLTILLWVVAMTAGVPTMGVING